MISHNVNESNQINMWSLASYRFGGDSDVAKDTLMFNMFNDVWNCETFS